MHHDSYGWYWSLLFVTEIKLKGISQAWCVTEGGLWTPDLCAFACLLLWLQMWVTMPDFEFDFSGYFNVWKEKMPKKHLETKTFLNLSIFFSS